MSDKTIKQDLERYNIKKVEDFFSLDKRDQEKFIETVISNQDLDNGMYERERILSIYHTLLGSMTDGSNEDYNIGIKVGIGECIGFLRRSINDDKGVIIDGD